MDLHIAVDQDSHDDIQEEFQNPEPVVLFYDIQQRERPRTSRGLILPSPPPMIPRQVLTTVTSSPMRDLAVSTWSTDGNRSTVDDDYFTFVFDRQGASPTEPIFVYRAQTREGAIQNHNGAHEWVSAVLIPLLINP
jgi:hypothetical protein